MVVLHIILMAIVFGPSVSSLNLTPKEFPFLKTQMNDEKHATAFNKLLNSIVKTNQKRLDTIKKLTKLQATDVHPSLEDPLPTLRSTRRESAETSDETNIIYLVIPETPNPSAQNTQHSIETQPNPPSTILPIQPKHQPERLQLHMPTFQDFAKFKASNPSPSIDARPSLSASAPSLNASPTSLNASPTPLNASPTSLNASPTSYANPRSSMHGMSKEGLEALRVSIARSCKSKEVKRCKSACKAAVKNACEEYSCKKKLKKRLKKNCKRECKEEFRGLDEW